jgi:hypothetical protein
MKKFDDLFKRCPKTGNIVGINAPANNDALLYRLLGFFALLWFALRVIPKPSRALYPCQRIAMPLALSFLVWLSGVTGLVYVVKLIKGRAVSARTILIIALILQDSWELTFLFQTISSLF